MKPNLLTLSAIALFSAGLAAPVFAQAIEGSGSGDRSVSVDVPMGGPSIEIGDQTGGSLAVDAGNGSIAASGGTAIEINGTEIGGIGGGLALGTQAEPGAQAGRGSGPPIAPSHGPGPAAGAGTLAGQAGITNTVKDTSDCAAPVKAASLHAPCPRPVRHQ